MKKLTKSTVLGCKRKASPENKENQSCITPSNSLNPRHNSDLGNRIVGVFQSSISTPFSILTNGNEVRIDRSNRYKTNKRTPLSDITITPTTNDTIGSEVVIDRSNESTVTTLTHNVSTSIMECRNLNKDFNEACTEEDTTTTESIG
nr:uncharacterized protein LOC109154109 [Ipomoea batatas]